MLADTKAMLISIKLRLVNREAMFGSIGRVLSSTETMFVNIRTMFENTKAMFINTEVMFADMNAKLVNAEPDLGNVIDYEKAVMCFFVTLAEPTRPMREEAIKAGYYESATGASFPKIQILTVKGLIDGTERPNYPDLTRGGLMFNKARREQTEKQRDLFGGGQVVPFDRTELPRAADPAEAYSDDPHDNDE